MKQIFADSDVHNVLEFMQKNIEAAKLVTVARAVADVGAVLWRDVMPYEEPTAILSLTPIGGMHGQQLVATDDRGVDKCLRS